MSTRKRNAAAYRPRAGELVLDTRTGRTGIYMDTLGGEHYLRPPDGGREWTTRPDQVAPAPAEPPADPDDPDPNPAPARAPTPVADDHARLHARLAARNGGSRLNESQVARRGAAVAPGATAAPTRQGQNRQGATNSA